MAFGTGRQFLPRVMRLVTGETGRFEPMGSMARLTGKFRMLAREFDELFLGGSVTFGTCIQKTCFHGNFLGGVGVRVAVRAVGNRLAMWFGMT